MSVITSQTGAKKFNGNNITDYSLFVGGVNATHHALQNYSPAMNGFGRLFMVRPPMALATIYGEKNIYSQTSKFVQFKHILEYMNRSVTGFQDKTLENAATPIQGGFAGRQFNTPTVTKEQTNSITIGLYELEGLPIFDVIDTWMNMIGDENSGLATYGGYISGGYDSNGNLQRMFKATGQPDTAFDFNEAWHTAEFIYLLHDRSGAQVQRAVMLADVYPTGIAQSPVLDMAAGGTHDNITYDVTFNCVVYRSSIITAIANDLLKQYRIVSNSLNFNPELGDSVYASVANGQVVGTQTKVSTDVLGPVPMDHAVGTNVGNMPVFLAADTLASPKTAGIVTMNGYPPTDNSYTTGDPKLAGGKVVTTP